MKKIFYDHLIVIEDITIVLDAYKLSTKEKVELVNLVDETMHNEILDVILTHLPKHVHESFLKQFHLKPHDKNLIPFINQVTGVDIEKKILARANFVKKKFLEELK